MLSFVLFSICLLKFVVDVGLTEKSMHISLNLPFLSELAASLGLDSTQCIFWSHCNTNSSKLNCKINATKSEEFLHGHEVLGVNCICNFSIVSQRGNVHPKQTFYLHKMKNIKWKISKIYQNIVTLPMCFFIHILINQNFTFRNVMQNVRRTYSAN